MGAYTNDRRNNNLRACFFFLVFFFFFFFSFSLFFPLSLSTYTGRHSSRCTCRRGTRVLAGLLHCLHSCQIVLVPNLRQKKKGEATKKEMSGWCTTSPSSSLPPSGFGFILTSSIALQPRPFLVLLLVTLVIVHFCPSSTDFLNDDRTSTHEDVYSRKRPTTVNAVFQGSNQRPSPIFQHSMVQLRCAC